MTRARFFAFVLASSLLACTTDGDDSSASEPTAATNDPSADTTAGESSAGGDDAAALGCALPENPDTTDGNTTPLQDAWGSACTSDAECVARIGDGAVCLDLAVVYELPLGYCSKPCSLPDSDTRVVPDDPTCDPNGGIACVGLSGALFEYCAPLCNDDAQCNRDGYVCRQMPVIAQPQDPSLCLMPDCCEGTCDPND
jgi:hypothetical protein